MPMTPTDLAAQHIGYAAAVAKKFKRSRNFPATVEEEEMIADAYVGLMRAARKYHHVTNDICFKAFSHPYILGSVIHGLRERAWEPKSQIHNPGKTTMSPLSRHLKELRFRRVTADLNLVELRDWSDHLMRHMTEREAHLVKLIHFHGMTAQSAGEQIGVKKSRAQGMLQDIYARLRSPCGADDRVERREKARNTQRECERRKREKFRALGLTSKGETRILPERKRKAS